MPKRQIETHSAPPPGGAYSQAIAAGNLVFLAGQGPFRPSGEKVEGSFEAHREFFPAPLPARTTIQSDLPGFDIEVDAVLLVES